MQLLIHADGGCSPTNPGPSRCGIVVRDGTGAVLQRIAKELGPGTNNTAEWSALILALCYAVGCPSCVALDVRMDSKLVVEQVNWRWKTKQGHLKRYRDQADKLVRDLRKRGCRVNVEWIPREENDEADMLTQSR